MFIFKHTDINLGIHSLFGQKTKYIHGIICTYSFF